MGKLQKVRSHGESVGISPARLRVASASAPSLSVASASIPKISQASVTLQFSANPDTSIDEATDSVGSGSWRGPSSGPASSRSIRSASLTSLETVTATSMQALPSSTHYDLSHEDSVTSSPTSALSLLRQRLSSDAEARNGKNRRDSSGSVGETESVGRQLRKARPSSSGLQSHDSAEGSVGGSKPGSIMSYETRKEEVEPVISPEEGIGGTMEAHDEALSIHQDNKRLASDLDASNSQRNNFLLAGPRLGYQIVVGGTSLATSAALLPFRIALFPLTVARAATNTILDTVLSATTLNPPPISTPRRFSDPGNTSIDPGTPVPSSKAASIHSEIREDKEKGILLNVVETSLGIGLASACIVIVGADFAWSRLTRGRSERTA